MELREPSGKGLEAEGRGKEAAMEKNKEVLELSEDPAQHPDTQNLENPEISKEEGRDSSDSESEVELTQTINNKKPGRKSYRNKRESTTNREKELGIQKNY
jgi:predicted P-loop ATPase